MVVFHGSTFILHLHRVVGGYETVFTSTFQTSSEFGSKSCIIFIASSLAGFNESQQGPHNRK